MKTEPRTFTGFGKEAVRFLEDLEANNEREWFNARKDVYSRACKEPMEALLAELEPKWGAGKLFRIYRDTRFSKDKTPYKTYVAASFESGYMSLSTDGFSVASGAYMLDADGLSRFRDAVVADVPGKALQKLADSLQKKGYQVGAHETLKTTPRGYPKDHPRDTFLRQKGLYAWKGFPAGPWLATRKVYERTTTVLTDLKPLNAWLDEHVRA